MYAARSLSSCVCVAEHIISALLARSGREMWVLAVLAVLATPFAACASAGRAGIYEPRLQVMTNPAPVGRHKAQKATTGRAKDA